MVAIEPCRQEHRLSEVGTNERLDAKNSILAQQLSETTTLSNGDEIVPGFLIVGVTFRLDLIASNFALGLIKHLLNRRLRTVGLDEETALCECVERLSRASQAKSRHGFASPPLPLPHDRFYAALKELPKTDSPELLIEDCKYGPSGWAEVGCVAFLDS